VPPPRLYNCIIWTVLKSKQREIDWRIFENKPGAKRDSSVVWVVHTTTTYTAGLYRHNNNYYYCSARNPLSLLLLKPLRSGNEPQLHMCLKFEHENYLQYVHKLLGIKLFDVLQPIYYIRFLDKEKWLLKTSLRLYVGVQQLQITYDIER